MHSQKHQLEKLERVEYKPDAECVFMNVTTVSGEITPLIYLFHTRNDFQQHQLEWVEVNVQGTSIDFFRCPSGLHAKYCYGNVQPTLEPIHNHLRELLGNHTKFCILGCFSAAPILPMLRNIHLLHILDGFESTQIDEYLSRSPCLEFFFWSIRDGRHIRLSGYSRLYELDTVYLWTESPMATDVVKHFNGRHAFLLSPNISTMDVVQFLNAWKSGEKFRNLEVISMNQDETDSEDFEIPEIRTLVKFKEVAAEVEYSYVRKFPEYDPFYSARRYSWQLKSRFYMVRESDGHVATVLLTPSRIFMGVWNMTETEFLEKFH